ncbi:hypothetical protein A2G96_09610 [Cupriavidus nantongensis]|uniref:Uncharacterized protein n=1 Tax=Cupriavidus nantongensis TaxID=1796606 RepID=A0A142JIR3_9BURK|nr:hypothetical protein A2G96_09610 [Cupriavidus nantongensis]
MSLLLNPVSFGISVLALVVGLLAIFFNSMLGRRNGWLEPTLCAGGFVLSAVCTVGGVANGPYPHDISPLVALGGAGIFLGVIGTTAPIVRLWQKKRTGA